LRLSISRKEGRQRVKANFQTGWIVLLSGLDVEVNCRQNEMETFFRSKYPAGRWTVLMLWREGRGRDGN
jgi:hypothetical protein